MRLALVLLVAAACGGTKADKPDAAIDAWKKGGLDVSEFKSTNSTVGKDCSTGTVSKIDVLICRFETPDAAKTAQDLGLQWVGDTTGMSQARGLLVIAAADRRKTDPSGRTINQIFKLLPH